MAIKLNYRPKLVTAQKFGSRRAARETAFYNILWKKLFDQHINLSLAYNEKENREWR